MWYFDYVGFVGSEAGFGGSREKSGSSSCETSFSSPNMESYRGDRRNMHRDLFSGSCPSLLRGGREWGLSSLLEDAREDSLELYTLSSTTKWGHLHGRARELLSMESWKVEGEYACSRGSRACGLSFTEVERMIIIEKSSYSSSLESEGLRFLDAPSYRDLENWIRCSARGEVFFFVFSKLSKTLIANFWSLRSIDVELTELGRSGDQHSSSVYYGSRALSVKLGEVNFFYQ
ncbi:hypothetical protein Bca4012_090500 [Brassica carinata]